jgi:hypothetical protein
MFESLKETVRTFSFASMLKGNILSSPMSYSTGKGTKGNSPASNLVSNRYLSTYYNKMKEIKDYEITELTSTIMSIYMDFLVGYFQTDADLVTIANTVPNQKKLEDRVNKAFNELDVRTEVREHLWDIIYEGAWCFKKIYNPQTQTYEKAYLQNPHNVVTIRKGRDTTSHLVVSREGKVFETKSDSIFRIGKLNLSLINDINKKFFDSKPEDTLIADETLLAGTPLYYNICNKVKEYLLKEQILTLLSIKDLVQPLLLLIRLDKNTPVDEGQKLALNVETMINKYSDISSILTANFNINGLMDSLMNNIRVLPDYQSNMGDMNNVDLSKITNKISEIETSLENKKDVIMSAKAIPRALYSGDSTKWDAIKSSQRLNSTISGYATGITESLKLEAINLINEIYQIKLDPSTVTINLFKKTEVDYSLTITNIEIISTLTEGITRILTNTQQALGEIKIIDQVEYSKYVLDQLKSIDPNISTFINEDLIKKAIQEAQAQQAQQQ